MAEVQGCESCREWREHYYQEHVDVSRTRFFKLMTGDFAHRLSIPRKFRNALEVEGTRGVIGEEGFVDLKAPSGETWSVGVTERAGDGELFFASSGWRDFVGAHALRENDLLVFTRSGNRSFDVAIFDATTGCEKVSSFFVGRPCCMHYGHFEENDVVVVPGRQAADARCGASGFGDSDDDDTSSPLWPVVIGSAHKASASKKVTTGKAKPRQEPESPYSNSYHIKEEEEEEEESDDDSHDGGSNIYIYYSRSASILTEGEREEIFSLASINPGNPALVTVLQNSHLNRKNNILIVHSGFAADHLSRMRSREMLLLRPDKKDEWCVRYYDGRYKRGFSCRGWVKFLGDNGLRKDDVCVFELKKGCVRRKKTMVVHVFRKVKGRFVLVG